MKKKSLFLLLPAIAMIAVGCGTNQNGSGQGGGNQDSGGEQETEKQFTGIELESYKEVSYDGESHSLELTGVPEGATVVYEGGQSEFTAIGTYDVSVTISMEGYESLTLEGQLVIKALEFTGLSFEDDEVDFDGLPHSISVTGAPEGAEIDYGEGGNTFVHPGTHEITATITKENYVTKTLTATLTINAETVTQAVLVDDFEGIGDSDLASDWDLEFFKDNAWITPTSASIKVAKNQVIGEGTSTMRMNMSHQGSPFKVTKSVAPLKKFSAISLNVRADSRQVGATMKAQVQLWFKNLPLPEAYEGYKNTYATYTLKDNISTNWTHFEIPLNDSTLSIASDSVPVAALSAFGLTPEDLSLYVEKVAVLMYPNYLDGGPKAYAFVDDVKFTNATSRAEIETVKLTDRVYTIASSDNTAFKLSIKEGENQSVFETLNLEGSQIVKQGTAVVNGANLTVTTSDNIIFKMKASHDGYNLEFLEMPSGAGAIGLLPYMAHFGFEGKVFNEVVTVDNFEGYSATGVGLDNKHNEGEMSGLRGAYHSDYCAGSGTPVSLIGDSQWILMGSTDYLNLETNAANVHSGSKSGDFKGSTNQMRFMTFGIAKGNAQPIGRGQQLSLWVKGNAATTLNVRAWYVDKVSASNQGTTSGDAAYLGSAPITTGWTQITLPLDAKRDVYGFSINPAKTNARIYVDDVELIGDANPYAKFTAPETINDGTFGVVAGDKAYSLAVSNNVTTATFGELGTTPANFTCEMANGVLTLKDTVAAGQGVTVKMTISGGKLTVAEVTGAQSASFTPFINGTLSPYAHVNYDFQQESTSNHTLADPNWVGQYYQDSWKSHSNQMNVRSSGSNVFCNMTTKDTYDTTFTYTPTLPIGPCNHFSVGVANDFDGAVNINAKIKIIKTDNTESYIFANEGTYNTIPPGTGNRLSNNFYQLDLDFPLCNVKAVKFILKAASSGSHYLYFDNLVVNFKAAS